MSAATNAKPTLMAELSKEESDLFYDTMYRMTDGLPAYELQSIATEAADCEAALEKEIQMLEASIAAAEAEQAEAEAEASVNGKAQTEGTTTNNTDTSTTAPASAPTAAPAALPHPAPAPAAAPVLLHTPIIPPEYDATNTSTNNYLSSTDQILATELSPLDRYFTVSALLGRMREPFHTPPPPHSGLAAARLAALAALEKKKTKNNLSAAQSRKIQSVDKYQKIFHLKDANEIYTMKQTDNAALLALVKRISNHRTATVFRKAVDPKEAPGYSERILFPIDLTLIKKMVVCGYIQTFEELHQHIGLICHNCVKFNGRDSDYTLLTRDFETYVDDSFLDFLFKQKEKVLAATKAAAATKGSTGGEVAAAAEGVGGGATVAPPPGGGAVGK